MATLTIRNLADDLIDRLKRSASSHGRSMEQEVRELLRSRYPKRSEVLSRVRERWSELPELHADEVTRWRDEGRR